MAVTLQKLVSKYKSKSGEKVEFDILYFMDSIVFVLYIDGLRFLIFKTKKKMQMI